MCPTPGGEAGLERNEGLAGHGAGTPALLWQRGQVTGTEITGTRFPECKGGYNKGQVDFFLARIADLTDKGFAPNRYPLPQTLSRHRWVRGYDTEAVDRYLAGQAREDAAAGLRALPPVPVNPSAGDHARSLKRGQRLQFESDREAEWRQVSDLPGVRLRRTAGKVTVSSGEILLTRRRRTVILATGPVLRLDSQGQPRILRYERQLTDAVTGAPLLWLRGHHSFRRAAGRVLFPCQRYFIFPVSGTRKGNAVMTAVSESGATVLWIRHLRRHEYDVVVNLDYGITPEILCVIELTAGWLADYCTPSGH
jgi:DivIVA domain-containing protein